MMKIIYRWPVTRTVLIFTAFILLTISPAWAQQMPLPLPPSPETRANVWAVTLAPGANPDEEAARLGLINGGAIPGTPDTYAFRGTGAVEHADIETMQAMNAGLATSTDMIRVVQQELLERTTRVPTDPGYASQWHLNNTGQFGGNAGNDVNAQAAWALGYTGAGVVVASVDDGLWHANIDLTANYLSSASWDFGQNDNDPSGGGHGTSVGGVMAAVDNGVCGVGAAYNAKLAGIRLLNASTDANEAQALSDSFENIGSGVSFAPIDIFNSSWGPYDDGTRLEGPGPLTEAALAYGVVNGRGGLGSIYVWAAGNGGNNDSVNADGYANSRYTIAVAATTNRGQRSFYSELGAPILINAPSDGGTAGIYTTAGNPSGCTSSFGGTSSASPLAAGVIALILQANPNLTWRDVQHILVQSAEQNDPAETGWVTNGAGRHFNHYYGYGRIDAGAAVALAQSWTNVAPETLADSGLLSVNAAIPDGLSETQAGPWITRTFNVTQNIEVEAVDVIFDAKHTWRGDLQIELISPSGMTSILMNERKNDNRDDFKTWRLGSMAHWGELSAGTWTIRVRDARQHLPTNPQTSPPIPNTGTFNSWQLKIYGTASGNTLITRQPESINVLFDEPISVSVNATGSAPISYQWYSGVSGDTSNPIGGANSSTYNVPPLQMDMQLWVRATGPVTSADSLTSTLTVVNEVPMLEDMGFNDTGLNDWRISSAEAWILCGGQFTSSPCALRFKNTLDTPTVVKQKVALNDYRWSLRAGDTLRLTGNFKGSGAVTAHLQLIVNYMSPVSVENIREPVVITGGGWNTSVIEYVLTQADIDRIRVKIKDKSTIIGPKMFADDVQLMHQRGSGTRREGSAEAGEQPLALPAAPDIFRGSN